MTSVIEYIQAKIGEVEHQRSHGHFKATISLGYDIEEMVARISPAGGYNVYFDHDSSTPEIVVLDACHRGGRQSGQALKVVAAGGGVTVIGSIPSTERSSLTRLFRDVLSISI